MDNKRHQFWRYLYKLHRYIGLLCGIVLLMLAATGILLNHTEDFKLDRLMVKSDRLLDWYGIRPPEPVAFQLQSDWLSQLDNNIYFNTQAVFNSSQKLVGAVRHPDYLVAALERSILLLTEEAELIEQIPMETIVQLTITPQNHIVFKTRDGIFFTEDGFLSQTPQQQTIADWPHPASMPDELSKQLKQQSRHNILPWERVFLDLHSGRLFGNFGVFIVDATGVLLIFLVLSGTAIWVKHKIRTLLHHYRINKQP